VGGRLAKPAGQMARGWWQRQMASGPTRRCSQVVVPTGGRVVAVGDIHGDAEAFDALLSMAELVDDQGSWCAGQDIMVQVGDVLDRGIGEVHILQRLDKLRVEAEAAGGMVIQLAGNHELMNYRGDFRYVYGPWGDGFKAFEDAIGPTLDANVSGWREELAAKYQITPSRHARAAAFLLDIPELHPEIRPFRRADSVAVVVGDSLFVHAGLLPVHLELSGGELEVLNNAVRQWVRTAPNAPVPPVLGHPHGPLWTRRFGEDSFALETLKNLDAILESLGCSRMVVGHTPQPLINGVADGKLWRIDTGMSKFMSGGSIEAMEITADGTVSILRCAEDGGVEVVPERERTISFLE